jgi:hypothetical protein
MLDGLVVPILGARVWGKLPDSDHLASQLAEKFGVGGDPTDLAEVAQYVAITRGPAFLHRELENMLRVDHDPGEIHAFLGRLARAATPTCPMIVTTNYDTALERAFAAEGVPYDLAVFVGGPTGRGTFVHIPWGEEPRIVGKGNEYREFPMHRNDELSRSIIVKVSGGQGLGGDGDSESRYVLTEDQYIDYLVSDEISTLVPVQILTKLKYSHCLFLGYAMADWSLRVFLKRVWQGRPIENQSWAIERQPDALEKSFWSQSHVELLAASPDDYARELSRLLDAWSRTEGKR